VADKTQVLIAGDGTPVPISYADIGGGLYGGPVTNVEGTLLASAVRAATNFTADQVNPNARGVRVSYNITAVPGTDTITVQIQGKDPVSGNYFTILAGAAQVATGQKPDLIVYPGVTATANVAVSEPLPRTWRVNVVHSAASNFTYSVGFSRIA